MQECVKFVQEAVKYMQECVKFVQHVKKNYKKNTKYLHTSFLLTIFAYIKKNKNIWKIKKIKMNNL